MAECNHDCSSCKKDCEDRKADFHIEGNKNSKIKKIIAVASGKGGVGKSTVTSLLAVNMMKKGYKVGILDADITGPSIPHAFGVTDPIYGDEEGMIPQISKQGIKIVSINLLLQDATQPVVWRGPVLANAVKQFYSDVKWGEIDYLFVDMPPGTGDVVLTVFQSLPIDGVVIVTSPQDMVKMIVGKAIHMCELMDLPLLGLVENMAYFTCPCCGNPTYPFGPSKLAEVANEYQLTALASLPIDIAISSSIDNGNVEDVDTENLDKAANLIVSL